MNKKRIKNTIKLIILFFLSISLFLSCKKNDIFDTVVTKPVVVASDHPVFSHDSGIYPPGMNVTITCTTPGAVIRYTDDGTDPKTSGTAVEGPSPLVYNVSGVNNHTVIKAFTYTAGMWDSDRFSAIIVKSYTMEKAAAPVISHASQTFIASTAPTITITSLTVTAGFKYTIDGTDPKVSGTAMTAAQPLNMDLLNDLTYRRNINLRIISVAPGYNDSDELTRTYIVQIDTPVITGDLPGTYNNDVSITNITCAAAGSLIYYTLNGTEPTTASTLYIPGTITINNDSLSDLRVKAFRTNSDPSITVSRDYTLQAAQPSLSPGAGASYTGNNDYNISITTTTIGATIRYTIDNSPPTGTSPIYAAPIPANLSFPVRAKAFRANYQDSIEASRTYYLRTAIASSHATNTYYDDFTATFSTSTTAAYVLYTVDGSNPTHDGSGNPTGTTQKSVGTSVGIWIDKTTTVRAIGWKGGSFLDSNILSRAYTMQVANPSFSLAGGTYNNNTSTTITTTTTGAIILYTTDGSDPTHDASGNPTGTTLLYSGAIAIDKTMTIKAVGWKNGYNDSTIVPQTYTMVALDPTFAPAVGFYPGPGPLNVTLATGTTTATVYYTADGSDPNDGFGNPSGTAIIYAGAIPIAGTTILRFFAYQVGYTSSSTIQMTITESAGDFTVTSP